MSLMYIVLGPIAIIIIIRRLKRITFDIKIKNYEKLKSDILFLISIIITIGILIYFIEKS
ncbi:hypothetical protein SDC9_93312 [bioreactor metagenome]|uniref:Uncharacterized protein n=1 Tax=bioreactor metagenome TaxID=1076179 RepID=A0A645A0M4_9ZZZZ